MSITALTVVTEATERPISLADAKAHLRITHNAEDAHIGELIGAASRWAADYTRRILLDTQVVVSVDCFPDSGDQYVIGYSDFSVYSVRRNKFRRQFENQSRDRAIFLPGGRVTAVNDIDYTDAAGAPQTLTGPTSAAPGTDYQEDLSDDEWPWIYPARESSWPSTQNGLINAVSIDYQAGWLTVHDIPDPIRQAIRFKMADMFTIRDTADAGNKSMLLQAAENLLDPYVVTMI